VLNIDKNTIPAVDKVLYSPVILQIRRIMKIIFENPMQSVARSDFIFNLDSPLPAAYLITLSHPVWYE
jgi:hypothetical protein